MAASSIGQYERSVRALDDYYRTVELGLGACVRGSGPAAPAPGPNERTAAGASGAVVFGSDQGLVGRFNDVVADHAIETLSALSRKPLVWVVGERVHLRLSDAGLPLVGHFTVPNSVNAMASLVGQILVETETDQGDGRVTELHLVYNRPESGAVYAPVSQRLLPLDDTWRRTLAAMQFADKNIDELLEDFAGKFHRVRQSGIDEELFDVIAGFEVLAK